jgi:hypothetical protein
VKGNSKAQHVKDSCQTHSKEREIEKISQFAGGKQKFDATKRPKGREEEGKVLLYIVTRRVLMGENVSLII